VRCTWTTTTKSRTATATTPLQNTIDHSHIRRTFVRFCVIYISSSLWSLLQSTSRKRTDTSGNPLKLAAVGRDNWGLPKCYFPPK
jgi:hypothetical protein